MTLNEYRDLCHKIAKSKGWYDDAGERNIGEQLMLVVTEVAEAMEDLRVGAMSLSYDSNGKPCGFPIEVADVMIRLFDLAGYLQIDLEGAVDEKIAYNETRPHRHGGKLA
jgi:NTP pyrophosphatase (non-canonical NTP hydrolase)